MSTEIRSLNDESVSYRLPRTAVPKRYQIYLEPDSAKSTFSGKVDIATSISTESDEILLNAAELTIASAQAVDKNGRVHKATFRLDADNERVILKFEKQLPAGEWKVQLAFNGTLNDKLRGFYRSAYKDDNGKEHILAVTQCEPTDARRIFPCFDEPDFKAIFHTSVLVDRDAVALSNSPVESEEPRADGSKKLVVFKDTMTMSTYLFALVVGDLEATEPVDADGTPIRVWTPLGKLRLAPFSVQIAQEALVFFNRYYGITYPGEKLDLVAVPDFMFGAMENLGCVIFRENALLVDEKNAAQQELERIADIVAHELAHMWFGDLATMRWWNGLWLNEAFATFMNMLAINEMRPEWKRWDTFGVSRGQAFATDGLLSTRPIEFNVRKPEDAEGMFDVLTYEKGGSVLRMLEQYLGAEQYRLGIAHYLNAHQYSNTETTDLWDAIEEKSDQPVRNMMDSWIFQGGYPVVHASREEGGKSWLITQHRFFYLPEEKRSHIRQESVSHYHVPIMYRAMVRGKIVEGRVLLQGNSIEIELEHPAEWVLLNAGGHGFYRCVYSDDELNILTKNLFEILAPIERFNLLSDLWASAQCGSLPLKTFFAQSLKFKDETDKNVWTTLTNILTYLDRLVGKEHRSSFKEYVRELVMPALNKIGLKAKKNASNSGAQEALADQLRGMLFAAAGVYGEVEAVIKEAEHIYACYKKDSSTIGPALTAAAIQVLASQGNKAQYDEFANQFKNAATPQEEERFMYALAAFRDPALLTRTLEKTINGEIRTQNAPYIVRSVMFNPWGREQGWEFMKANWQKLQDTFPNVMIPRMCEGITGLISDQLLGETQKFFESNDVKQGRKTISQHLEKLAVAVYLRNREKQTLERSWTK